MTQMYQAVPAMAPVAPAFSLWKAAAQLPDSIRSQWSSGISFRSKLQASVSSWPIDCDLYTVDGDLRQKPGARTLLQWSFGPIALLLEAVTCRYVTDDASWVADLEAMFDAGFSNEFGYQFWTGALDPNTPSLMSTAAILNADDADGVDPRKAVDYLIAKFAQESGGGGMFVHFPAVLAGFFLEHLYMTQVGSTYYGPMGAIMVPDFGYPFGAGEYGPAGAASTDAQAWIYVTSRVERDMGTVQPWPKTPAERAGILRQNVWTGSVEAPVIWRFEPGFVWAQLVNLPNSIAGGS